MVIPSSFRTLRALERLNVAGVGLSLAAMTAAVFRGMLGHERGLAFWVGVPTVALGALWAQLLRSPRTVGQTTIRRGWLLSIPLAALNAGLAAGLMLSGLPDRFRVGEFFAGILVGVTFGAMFWGPALILTLLCFGLPIAWGQRLSRQGLAGQERGEVVVGVASALLALMAFSITLTTDLPVGLAAQELRFTQALALAGGLCGAAAIAISIAREHHRWRFVAEVEAGRVEHFRIDTGDGGKALMRVVSQGQGYRVADLEEEVAALDREGQVTRAAR